MGARRQDGASDALAQAELGPALTRGRGSLVASAAARHYVAKSARLPLLLGYAQYDPEFLSAPTLALAHAVCERDRQCPPVLWMKGHNHVSTVFSIGSQDTELGRNLVDFIRATR